MKHRMHHRANTCLGPTLHTHHLLLQLLERAAPALGTEEQHQSRRLHRGHDMLAQKTSIACTIMHLGLEDPGEQMIG